MENINDQTACSLCFNIFPFAETTLHKLAKDDDKVDAADQIKAVELTKDLFEKCENGTEEEITGMEPGTPLKMPMLEDLYGATAIDYALDTPAKDKYGGIFHPDEKKHESF